MTNQVGAGPDGNGPAPTPIVVFCWESGRAHHAAPKPAITHLLACQTSLTPTARAAHTRIVDLLAVCDKAYPDLPAEVASAYNQILAGCL